MTQSPTVSLVIVSRKRRSSLRRTLAALRFQTFENFEVVVVSDAPDSGFLNDLPFAQNICHLHFDEPNISAARNIGIAASRGDIIAFCDDDAVPDPCWLERLIAPFEHPNVASAGGFVRARNGIEYQWKALLTDCCGDDSPLTVDEDTPFTAVVFDGTRCAKLQGTNCAFRKTALDQVGGFDDGIRFFLDETDVCWRLALAGYDSAFVPMAQVHHGFAASEHRSADRAPKSLTELGASKARFLNKHAEPALHAGSIQLFIQEQRNRLIALMVDGRIEPRDVARLMTSLQDGLGEVRTETAQQPQTMTSRSFTRFGHTRPDRFLVLGGSTLSKRKLLKKVKKNTEINLPQLVMIFSITSLFHRRDFDAQGFWVHSGGIFGRFNRSDPLFRFVRLNERIKIEFERAKTVFPGTELRTIKIFRNFVLEMTKTGSS